MLRHHAHVAMGWVQWKKIRRGPSARRALHHRRLTRVPSTVDFCCAAATSKLEIKEFNARTGPHRSASAQALDAGARSNGISFVFPARFIHL
jgi:hypothetical protein